MKTRFTSLTVDLSNGDPLTSQGLTFNGMAGAVNPLNFNGGSENDTVTVNANLVVATGVFAPATINYSNISIITFDGGGGSDVLNQTAQPGGNAALVYRNTTSSDSLNISGGTFTFATPSAGTGVSAITLGTVSVGAGAKVVVAASNGHANRSLLTLNTLSLAGSAGSWTGTLDANDNDLVIHDELLSLVSSQIQMGFGAGSNGLWTGSGVTSTIAANDSTHLTALAAILNSTQGGSALHGVGKALGAFDGTSPLPTDILVKYTFYGDAKLDGKVDGSDYSLIDSAYTSELVTTESASGWYNGDFNYDGVVDGSDYALIDNAFNQQGASLASQVAAPAVQGVGHTTALFSRQLVRLQTVPASQAMAASNNNAQVFVGQGESQNKKRSSLWLGLGTAE